MQNNPLDDIVKCDIEIANPGSDDATFDSILLVVPAPEAEGIAKLTKTTAISKADELLNYGYTVEDGAYLAASVAFSQSPSPGDVYVVVRKSTIPEGAMEKALSEGQTHGGIAQTSFDADDNEIPGYVTSVPLASDLTEDQRKSRKLPNCRWRARLAGAIHLVEIDGTLRF